MKRWVIAGVLVLAGCGGADLPPNGQWHTGGPTTPEEQAVVDYITKYNQNPRQLRWLEFGPHDVDGRSHWRDDPKALKRIRVRYEAKPNDAPARVVDAIYDLDKENKVIIGCGNGLGTGWLADAVRQKQPPGQRPQ